MNGFRIPWAWWCWLLWIGPVGAVEFGAMLLQPRREPEVRETIEWVQTGGWDWIRVMAPPSTNLGAGLGRVLWPAARFEPAAFSPEISTARLAEDPWKVYDAARSSVLPQPVPRAYEIGNEPDIYFTPDLPDQMALTLKAAWWGIKSVQPDSAVLMPSLAARPGPYAELLARNRVGEFTDGWNLHLYGWAQDFPAAVQEHRSFWKKASGRTLPVWVTELGFAEFPELPAPIPEVLLARQQAFFERTTVAAAFSGIDRQWAFVLGPRLEQGQDYGLSSADGSPRPALESYLRLTRELSRWQPAFELRQRVDQATVGYVLEPKANPGAEWWVLLVSPHRRADISLPEIPGRPAHRQPQPAPEASWFEFELRFPDEARPVRLGWYGEQGIHPHAELRFTASAATNLFLRLPARRFSVAGCDWVPVRPVHVSDPPPTTPSPVALSFRFSSHVRPDKSAVAYRYRVGEPLPLTLRADNFGPEARNGRWRIALPAGWRATERSGEWQVPAGGAAQRQIQLHPPPAPRELRGLFRLEWRDERGQHDTAAGWLAPDSDIPADATLQTIPGRWSPTESDTVWQTEETSDGGVRMTLVNLRPGVTTGLWFPLPDSVRLRPDDVLRIRLRAATPESHFRRRVELVSPDRQVFRWGDDWSVDEEVQMIEGRVGDFTPAFWSRANPRRQTGPESAQYLRIGLFGLRPGAVVELGPVERHRPAR